MFSDGMVEYSDKQNTKTMAATSTMTLGNGDDLVWKSLGWSRTESAKMTQRIRLLAQMLRRWHQSDRLRRQMAQWQPGGAMVAMNEATRETRETRER